ncbi:MAG: ComEA family DNA-binding protein [Actinobacteria bacterium]|nr:ComEA family DNA-binding protein [Actinomycetota bacterium]MTB27033.1 ComEA family DNA-binding protein [Actinomycetota bacterium]
MPEQATHERKIPAMDRRSWRLLAVFAGVAMLFLGWLWMQGRPQPVASVSDVGAAAPLASGSPTSNIAVSDLPASGSPVARSLNAAGEVVVHVAGDVRKPGLLHLPAGSRVAEAISAAGGALNSKAESSVNLARLLVDGEQVMVGVRAQQVSTSQQQGDAQGSGTSTGKVSVNSANQQQLETLPGVGPSLAQRILEYRAANGSFRSVDELDEVSGIGPATLTRLRSLIQL